MNETFVPAPDARLPWHAATWARFAGSSARDSVAHALLIHGEGGLHKLHLGRQIGRALLCASPVEDGQACGRCKSCLLLRAGTHPDWIEVTPEDSAVIKIDQIRALSERLSMRPQIAQRQVAIIWPAERMNPAASNALLKTLEEPAGDTHLLLVCDRIGRLSATIRSRCQRLPVAPLAGTEGDAALSAVAKVDVLRAHAALSLSNGDPEAALSVLQAAVWTEWLQLAERLRQLAAGTLAAGAFGALYAKDGGRLLQRWSELIGFATRAEPVGIAPLDALSGLTSAGEMSRLLPLATQLERARGLLGSGVREDLLVYELSCRWAELSMSKRDRRA